jgi:hypothetical protein
MLLSAEWRTDPAKLVMEWATLPPDRHAYWALRLTDVRGFAHYVANLDPRTEVPPVGILPGWKRAKPYVSATRRSMRCWRRRWLCRQQTDCADGPGSAG